MKVRQLALGNYPYPLYPFDCFLDDAVSLGIGNIELWAASPHMGLDDYSLEMAASLHRKIRSRGLQIICFTPEQCAYPINIGSEDEIIRTRSLRYMLYGLQCTSLLECPQFLVTPGNGYKTTNKESTRRHTLDSLHLLDDAARKLGVRLVLEHLTKATTNLAILAEELFSLCDALGSSNLDCMVDTDMAWRYGQTAEEYIRKAEKRQRKLAHVHLVDGLPGGHLVPGDGVVPLHKSLMALQKADYEGYLTFEITNERYYDEPKMALARCLDWSKPYFTE